MSVASRLALPLVAVLVLGGGTGRAQEGASNALHARQGPPSRTIHLDVVVTRKDGEAVAGLKASDFTLLDDKKPTAIASFEEADTAKQPVEAILLIDSVNTPYTAISQVRIQVDKFLHANGGKLPLPLSIAVLGDAGVKMQHGYSRDGNALSASLAGYTIGLRAIGRSAGFEGAAERLDDSLKALRLLTQYESQRPGRKIILWVSPGWPLLSGPGVDLSGSQEDQFFNEITWLSTELREGQTTLYAIDPWGVAEPVSQAFYYEQFISPVKRPSQVNIGNLGLQVLATQTGGEVVNTGDISGPLEQYLKENLAYYRISFEPPPTEHRDVYHDLKVEMTDRALVAHTSTGYYAQP
ncbi:MAG: VWA domain-containing protein [Acidobacteriaceae bacterium]